MLARLREGSWYDYGPASAETLARAAAIDAVCQRRGVALKAAAVNVALTNPGVTSVVVGMAAPTEVDENLAAQRTPLPAEFWRELQSLEPTCPQEAR